MVTLSNAKWWDTIEMTPVRAALLSMFMLTGILMWGAGVYTAGAAVDGVALDGYGVTSASRY